MSTLTTSEILKKVRDLEIKSKKITTNIFSGEYHSAFKGRGMSFKEVREYVAGDDIRFIDWNTSARFGHPFSKIFEEERELTLMLLLDCSASNLAGTHQQQKKELIIEIAAVLAFAAINNNDKVGAILFTDKTELFIPPKKGRNHVLYIVRQMLTMEPSSRQTDIPQAINFFNQTLQHTGIVFLLSDFETGGFDKALKTVSKRHDCIAIQVEDKIEYEFPNAGLVPVQDAESGQLIWVDSSDEQFRKYWQHSHLNHIEEIKRIIGKCGWDYLRFQTGEDYVKILQTFFIKRIKH